MKDYKLTTFERRIEMLFFIIHCRQTTVRQLAQMFSVCKNTVYTDITFLSRYAPVYTKNGLHGGVFLLGEYRSDLFLYLSKEEQRLLSSLAEQAYGVKKQRLQNIIYKYAMPKIGT